MESASKINYSSYAHLLTARLSLTLNHIFVGHRTIDFITFILLSSGRQIKVKLERRAQRQLLPQGIKICFMSMNV